MRWLFLFVLLVNVAYVSWELSQPADEPATHKTGSGVPSIELLSETGQATSNPTLEPIEAVAEAPQPSREPAKEQKPAKASSPAPEKQQAAVTPPASRVPDVDRCYTLGPFRELDKLRAFTRAIKDYVATASFRSREEQEQALFLVYLEPSPTFEAAKALGSV